MLKKFASIILPLVCFLENANGSVSIQFKAFKFYLLHLTTLAIITLTSNIRVFAKSDFVTHGYIKNCYQQKDLGSESSGFVFLNNGGVGQLIVDKSSSRECYPNNPVRDTLVKTLRFMPLGTSNIYGSYFGYLDNNTKDTMTLTITQEVHQGSTKRPIARAHVFGGESFQFGYVLPGWEKFGIMSYPQTRPLIEGVALLDGDEISFEFIYEFGVEGKQTRIFREKKQ